MFLAWRFDALKFSLEVLGLKGSAEASKSNAPAAPGDTKTEASGPGSAAIGGDAPGANISTNVTTSATGKGPAKSEGTITSASGAGAVAIGGNADKAQIRTSVKKTNGDA